MGSETHDAEDLVDQLAELAEGEDAVSVDDVVEAIGHRGFGPLIFLPAIVEITPLGGIPGVPTFLALIIALVAVQVAAGRKQVWLPGFISDREVSGEKVEGAAGKLRGIAGWMDNWMGHRLGALTSDSFQRIAAVVVMALCVLVVPLEVLPFASSIPMLAIAVIGLAITARDGVLMLVGLAGSVAGMVAAVMLLSG